MQLPEYVCHKRVRACKIGRIYPLGNDSGPDGAEIVPADGGIPPFRVDQAFMSKHSLHVGGYFVEYEDGYQSFSPAAAFESGYTRVEEPSDPVAVDPTFTITDR